MNYSQLWRKLTQQYDEGEAKAIARMVYEVRYKLSLSDLLLGKDTELSADDQKELEEIAERLLQNEPVQYVLGKADFCGRTFHVAPGVLIPRPETEELCQWIISECRYSGIMKCQNSSILDIGTGSGCIAITLAAELSGTKVCAWDISEKALNIARRNAENLHVNINFQQVDVFQAEGGRELYSLIVSNPPYICLQERAGMEQNVLSYEPETALFVPDDNPLLFYRSIAHYATSALKEDGWLYFEINPLYADDIKEMLCSMQFSHIDIKKDQYDRQRMIRAQR